MHIGIRLFPTTATVALLDSSGTAVSKLSLPMLDTDQSFGWAESQVQAADGSAAAAAHAVYLATPTPGAANSNAASLGPVVAG